MHSLTLGDLRPSLHEDPPSGAVATVLVVEDDATAAVLAFREDRRLRGVRVRTANGVAGYLSRSDAYVWFPAKVKSFGDYQESVLPGRSRPGAFPLIRLHCPHPGCPDNPVFTLALDPDDPPQCRIHRRVLVPEGAP